MSMPAPGILARMVEPLNASLHPPARCRSLALLLGVLLIAAGPAAGEDEDEGSSSDRSTHPAIHNPYFEKTEWKVWRDDDSPVEDVPSMVREGKEKKVVRITIEAPPEATRIYPVAPSGSGSDLPMVAYEELAKASTKYAGIWDDVYSSWSGLHGYVRNRWKAPDGSTVTVRGQIIDFVDVTQRNTIRLGVNFIHQSTTGMAHAITNGVVPDRTVMFEKLYFADALLTAPAHASFTDRHADRSSDLFTAHVPTLFNSVGSSNSETMAITKMIIAGGYLPPETKRLLKQNGLYPAAMLHLWKAALPYTVPYDHELRHRVAYKSVGNRATYPEKYSAAGIDRGDLALAFHCYDDAAHMRGMVAMARSMDVALPEALLTVLDAEGGKGVYRLHKSALVIQEEGQDVTLRVSTENCYDLQDLPLTTRWKLLYGNKWTTVEPDEHEDSVYTITVPWDDALPEGRTAIALIANNGRFDSNPAIITVYRKKGDLPPSGVGPGDYKFPSTHTNRRPVLLDLQDLVVKRGRTITLPLRSRDPEGFPVAFYTRAEDVGEVNGNVFTWRCPRKEPKGPKTITIIASDGTSGNGYAGEQVTLHVEKPKLLAQIKANTLSGPAPLTVEVSAKESIGPTRKTEYGWDFYAPAVGRKTKAFEDLVQGREAKHTFQKPGVYEITLTVRSSSGSDTETVSVLVTKEPLEERPAAIAVEGNGVLIRAGDPTPTAFDHTDYGRVEIGKSVRRTFLLVNKGDGVLTLDRKAPIIVGGANARDFKVMKKPRTRIDGRGSSLFEVRFKPREAGARTATIEIHAGSETFVFTLGGMGVGR